MITYLVKSAFELGIEKALVSVGQIPEMISQKDAYDLYGKSNVQRWIKNNLIECVQGDSKSSPIRLSRIRLGILSKSFS